MELFNEADSVGEYPHAQVRAAYEAKNLLEVNGFELKVRGYSSTETTTLNNIVGEEPAFRERRELGQIGVHFLAVITTDNNNI